MTEESIKRKPATGQSLAALACFVGSVLCLAFGFALTTGWLLNAQRHPLLHVVGLVLLIIGLPILILGGHFLDLLEKKEKKSNR